jgi:hypothetical protein
MIKYFIGPISKLLRYIIYSCPIATVLKWLMGNGVYVSELSLDK